MTTHKSRSFVSIGSLFAGYQPGDSGKYISQEFQDYGYRLAAQLNDLSHKSLYIKLAKTVKRELLESARSFVLDADQAQSKAKLFMWKLKQLRQERGWRVLSWIFATGSLFYLCFLKATSWDENVTFKKHLLKKDIPNLKEEKTRSLLSGLSFHYNGRYAPWFT